MRFNLQFAITQNIAGDVYVMDHGLTAADCLQLVQPGQACELETEGSE